MLRPFHTAKNRCAATCIRATVTPNRSLFGKPPGTSLNSLPLVSIDIIYMWSMPYESSSIHAHSMQQLNSRIKGWILLMVLRYLGVLVELIIRSKWLKTILEWSPNQSNPTEKTGLFLIEIIYTCVAWQLRPSSSWILRNKPHSTKILHHSVWSLNKFYCYFLADCSVIHHYFLI